MAYVTEFDTVFAQFLILTSFGYIAISAKLKYPPIVLYSI